MHLIASVPLRSAVLQGHAGLGVVALRFHWEVKSTGHVARTFAVGGTRTLQVTETLQVRDPVFSQFSNRCQSRKLPGSCSAP